MSDGPGAEAEKGHVRKAAGLRRKYCKTEQILPLSVLGVHPKNRHGQFPQWERVRELGCQLLLGGFDVEEANHAGVCVAELPPEEMRCNFPTENSELTKDGKSYCTYDLWNKSKCAAVAALSGAWNGHGGVQYGTLSHSHLVLVLLCFRNGADWGTLPDEYKELEQFQEHPGGPWSWAKLCKKDPNLKLICEQGLRFQVLSWELFRDNPAGAALISNALNRTSTISMGTSDQTALKATLDAVERLTDADGKVEFKSVKAAVEEELEGFADEEDYLHMFSFVIDLGGRGGGFVPAFLDFMTQFVNAKHRQLRLSAYKEVQKFGPKYPRSKVAIMMRGLRQHPKNGYCPCPEPALAKAEPADKSRLEQLLQYLGHTCKPAVAAMPAKDWVVEHSTMSMLAADAFAKHLAASRGMSARDSSNALEQKLLIAMRPHYLKISAHWEKAQQQVPAPQATWIDFEKVAAAAAAAEEKKRLAEAGQKKRTEEGESLQPKVLSFTKEGLPQDEQESRAAGASKGPATVVAIPWKAWARSAAAQDLDLEAAHCAALRLVLHSHHVAAASSAWPVGVFFCVETKKRFAKATAAMQEGWLQLFPCAPRARSFPTKSNHPDRVEVQVLQKRPTKHTAATTYYLHPEWKAPEFKKAAAAAAEAGGEAAVAAPGQEAVGGGAAVAAPEQVADGSAVNFEGYDWQFKGDESCHPFWAVERLTQEELAKRQKEEPALRFNCGLVPKEYVTTCVGQVHDQSASTTMACTVPHITNTVPLAIGDVLLLQAEPKVKMEKKATVSWQDSARKEAQPKKKAKTDAAAAHKGLSLGGGHVL